MKIRFLLAGVLCVITAWAQEFRATLQGTIADPSRAQIAAASLTLKNTANGVNAPSTRTKRDTTFSSSFSRVRIP